MIHNRMPDCHPVYFSMDATGPCSHNTELSFDSQVTRVIDVPGLFLTCYPQVSVQPGTGRRPVDWYRNKCR